MKSLFILLSLTIFFQVSINAQSTSDCSQGTAYGELNINNVRAGFMNDGTLWLDQRDGFAPAHQFPYGEDIETEKHTIFTSSLILGGIDNSGTVKTSAIHAGYIGEDFVPGPIDDSDLETNSINCSQFNKIYCINQSTIELFINGYNLDPDETDDIYGWPGKGNPHLDLDLIHQDLAPFVDTDSDGIYNPDNGDYPKIKGEQSCWWVLNDLNYQSGEEPLTLPLGVEIHVEAFAFNQIPIFRNSTFYEYTIINKSGQDISDFIFGHYVDADLGEYQDDFIGCDPERNLGIAYNGDEFDAGSAGYGNEIPMQGVQVISVPDNQVGSTNKMSSFIYYENDFTDFGNPENGNHFYNYLNATWKNGQHLTYGTNGKDVLAEETNYMYPGSPLEETQWSECSVQNYPSDRRFILASGNYSFPSGSSLSFLLGSHVVENIEYPCPSFSPLFIVADAAETYFNNVSTNVNSIEISEDLAVHFYPNPAVNALNYNSEHTIESIKIFDQNGKLLQQRSSDKLSGTLDISALNPGVYMLKYILIGGQSSFEKLIVGEK